MNVPRVLMFVSVIPILMVAQTDPFSRGQKQFAEQQWDAAAASFAEAAKTNPQNGSAWFWLGLARYQDGKVAEAKSALEKADALNTLTSFTRFAIARCAARLNDPDGAFDWLDKAIAVGFNALSRFDSDSAMGLLKHDPRYAKTRAEIDKLVRPAEYDARFRQLDFWIGSWDVFDTLGNKQGTNVITKELQGAMLVERWTNVLGVEGSSINYFDPGTGTFKQQWVSQSGYNTSYEGGLVGKAMVMVGKNANLNGSTGMNRMTFTPNDDGSVRQFIESSPDNGKTWTPSFTGIYRRMPPPNPTK